MFYIVCVLTNLANSTGKHLCWRSTCFLKNIVGGCFYSGLYSVTKKIGLTAFLKFFSKAQECFLNKSTTLQSTTSLNFSTVFLKYLARIWWTTFFNLYFLINKLCPIFTTFWSRKRKISKNYHYNVN